ncbi:MAG: V-type ATP synthase subunit I [Oscillospiraceae bacterium]|nr:V-type ATP synthase subunit I [Oscillospiraceae bacterium]
MAIVKMKKLKLMVATPQREELLRGLMLLGCVEVSEPSAQLQETSFLNQAESSDLIRLRTEHTAVNNAIALLKKYVKEKGGLLSPLPEVTSAQLLDESNLKEYMDKADRVIYLDDKIRRLTAEETVKHTDIAALTPWADLDLPLDTVGTETSALILGTIPGTVDFAQAAAALEEATEKAELFVISSEKSLSYVALVCYREDLEAAQQALRPLGFAAVNLGDYKGTAAENIAAAEKALADFAVEKENCTQEIIALAEYRAEIKLCADTLATKVARAEAESKLMCSESVSVLEGWVPAENEETMATVLEKFDCAWSTEDPTEDEYPSVPVKLKNSIFSRCLNAVTEMYSLPAYNGIDPNPYMAPFFIFFYGMMMADMGYGILMVLATAVMLLKKKPNGMLKHFCELFFMCGISTIAWGAVTGGFFGDAPLQIAKILNPETTWTGLPYLISPLEDTVTILIGAVALGFVHIVTGMAIGFVYNIKTKNYLAALNDQLTWWVIFAGIGFAVLGQGTLVLIVGGVLLVLGNVLAGEGLGKITGIFGAIYNNVTGYFGDLLSYARLMALMLAGSVIAQVFNTIGAIPGNLFIFLLISIVGNALNLGLNLLGCFVHDLRLQCLEFFGKFYMDGGIAFRPLEMKTKYVNVSK